MKTNNWWLPFVPVGALLVVAAIVSGLGTILLHLNKVESPAFALGFAGCVLLGATALSMRGRKIIRRRPVISPTATKLYSAILSGFVASMVMAITLVIAYGVASALSSSDSSAPTLSLWLWHLTHNQITQTTNDTLLAAMIIQLAIGLLWACVYVFYAEPRLRGRGWFRGIQFSLVPWALSVLIFLPIVHGGFLGFALGAGPLPIIGNLILHVVYGLALGGIHALGDVSAPEGRWHLMHQPIEAEAERDAAIGIVSGVIIGLVIGYVNGAIKVDGTVLATQVEVMLAASAFLGSTGALLGSVTGLHLEEHDATDVAAQPTNSIQPTSSMPHS